MHEFPFDKVIFLCEKSGKAELVYDKSQPVQVQPKRDVNKELGITQVQSSIIPFGSSININDIFDEESIVKPKSKKSKKRNRLQRDARKINRK